MDDIVNLLKTFQPYAIAITFGAVYLAEHIIPQRREIIDHKHDVLNILVGIFNFGIAAGGGYFLQRWLIYISQSNFGLLHLFGDKFWLKTTIGFILIDLFMYWWHRANHEIGFLWRFHRFHHKDEKLNSTSAVRFHFVELILSYLAKFCLFPLLGLNVAAVVLHAIVLFPVIVFHHSNVSISKSADHTVRLVFVSPRMHRIHHSKDVSETNSNYGSVFPYWDSLFGSYIRSPKKEIEFGV
jgi:sterol desaturase/sphingolipid hydroxylase (fatty acid hydroxylase superfamily)